MMQEMEKMIDMNTADISNSVSSSTIRRDLSDITPPPSPEKKLDKSADLKKPKFGSGSLNFSSVESDVFQTSDSYKIRKYIENLLNYLENWNATEIEVSKNISNNFIVNDNSNGEPMKKNISKINPFRKNLNAFTNNSVYYNKNNPFLSIIQDEKNKESDILFYDSCILCSSSSCKAMNFLLYENACEAFLYEQNDLQKAIDSSSVECIFNNSKNDFSSNVSSEDNDQNKNKNCSNLVDDFDIFEDDYKCAEGIAPFSLVSIFELPKDNITLDSNCDWYISSDDEPSMENQNSTSIRLSENNISTDTVKINTRQNKKQYPMLSVNSKYICIDTQSVYESPRVLHPKKEQSFEEKMQMANYNKNEFEKKDNTNFNFELSNNINDTKTKFNEQGISLKKFEKSIILNDISCTGHTSPIVDNIGNNKQNINNNFNNQLYAEPFIGSIFIDDLASGSQSQSAGFPSNNDINKTQYNYSGFAVNQNCQQNMVANQNYNNNQYYLQSSVNNNMVPQKYNSIHQYLIPNYLNTNHIRTAPSLKNKLTINDYVNRARLAQKAQQEDLNSIW